MHNNRCLITLVRLYLFKKKKKKNNTVILDNDILIRRMRIIKFYYKL